jgi:2-dehydropantoate 2-reductase
MRIAVVGLGGVGGYLAASFVKAGLDVIGFARGEHLEAIQTHGIQIVEDNECWSVRLDTRQEDDLDGFFEGCFDLVLFCVKSYDLENSYQHIKSHIDENTVMISFSNGVSNSDVLRKLSDSIVLDGCVYILSHIEKSGVIRKKGKVFAAVFGGDSKATKKVASVFKKADLRYKTPSDIQNAIWKKYIFISAFATATSFYNKSIGYVYENHKDEVKTLLEEIASVAKTKGIEISDEVAKALDTASKVPYDSSTSMHLDFVNKKRVELESLSGYIVKEGKIKGIKTPLMKKMYESLNSRISR